MWSHIYMYTKKKNIPDDIWLTQSHLKLDYENFACATDSSRLGDWFYAENPGAVIHGFHDTQLNSSFLWLFHWSYMYSFDYWISCRQASITVSCNTFKAPWTDFQWVMSTFLTCTMSYDELCRDELVTGHVRMSRWLTGQLISPRCENCSNVKINKPCLAGRVDHPLLYIILYVVARFLHGIAEVSCKLTSSASDCPPPQ